MADVLPTRAKTLQVLETLSIGTIGGVLFLVTGLPGGLISGAMLVVGAAAMMGRSLSVPAHLAQAVLVLLGISLGSLMSRQLLQHISAYPLTIAILALATFCTTLGSSYYLQRMHGWDRTSAFLPQAPAPCRKLRCLRSKRAPTCPRSRWCRPCA